MTCFTVSKKNRRTAIENISFKSRIKPVTIKEFGSIAGRMGNNNAVKFPWTIADSVKAKDVYTTGVIDCSSCLITDGNEAVLLHLKPDCEANHAFSNVLGYLRGVMDLKSEYLQAVLLGSKNTKKSQDIYTKFQKLLQQFNIPFSELKNGKTPTSVAYRSETDEVLISNKTIDTMLKKGNSSKNALESGFEKVSIADCDEIL